MTNEATIIRCLKNLKADWHSTSLVASRFYRGDPSKGNVKLVNEVRYISGGSLPIWRIFDGERNLISDVSFRSRDAALEAIAGEFWNFHHDEVA